MPMTGSGWEFQVTRSGIQRSAAHKRTYGSYQVFIDGRPVDGLNGHVCECVGPGDKVAGSGRRISQGRYPLWTQFGRYRSIGYSTDTETAGMPPMPGILLEGTSPRTGILIHPGHPPSLYLSSIGCLNPTNPLAPGDMMNFWDSRARVIALIDSLRDFDPAAFEFEASTHIANASAVIDGEPMNVLPAPSARMLAAASSEPASLPVSKTSALACCHWLVDNFGAKLKQAVDGKTYRIKHLCAIICQETAYKWVKWIAQYDVATIVGRSVFDASGDYPGTERSAFPVNTAAFRQRYGDEFTNMLIEEANQTRRMQGWGDQTWVYKGYGLFQYDLQNVVGDEAFFRNKLWYTFDTCLDRCCKELDAKLKSARGDLWKAIKAYNGSGPAAEQYMQNVKVFTDYCAEVTGEKP
jgi:hypothetical protein